MKESRRAGKMFLAICISAMFLSCPLDDNTNGDLETKSVVQQILDEMKIQNPDFPEFSKPECWMPEQEIQGISEDEDKEIADVISLINRLISNPFVQIEDSEARNIFRAADYETRCSPATQQYSSCSYIYSENDGKLVITWTDTRMMTQEDDDTIYTWMLLIHYKGIDSDENEYNHPVMNILETSTFHPTGLIDTESIVRYYTKTRNCDVIEWCQNYFKYDSIDKKSNTSVLINECDFSGHYQHTKMRITDEWDEPEDLFGQPVYHWQSYLWNYSEENEFLWIDYYIDMETQDWSYTVYDENGNVAGSGSS